MREAVPDTAPEFQTAAGVAAFHPAERLLLGPGPSNLQPAVLEALSRPVVGHLDPGFIRMMDELKAMLRAVFRTDNAMTLPVSAPGSAGMELCFANLVEPGDAVVIARNGVFGDRMRENVARTGGVPLMVDDDWGAPVSVDRVAAALAEHPEAQILACVHAETSTGARSDVAALARLAREHDCLIIVDTVTSLGGIPVEVDAWELDAVYSGSQKCLSCTPGLSPVTISERALAKIRARQTPVRSWFLDLNLLSGYWNDSSSKRSYHHTAPVHTLMCLHEALRQLLGEGLEKSHARHATVHAELRDGLVERGFRYLVGEAHRLPMLNSVVIPEQLKASEAEIRGRLLNDAGIEVGAGLGALAGQIWRIGLMGHGARSVNVRRLLAALDETLPEFATK